jgi:hypothetical protein
MRPSREAPSWAATLRAIPLGPAPVYLFRDAGERRCARRDRRRTAPHFAADSSIRSDNRPVGAQVRTSTILDAVIRSVDLLLVLFRK